MPQVQGHEGIAWAHGFRYSDDFETFKYCPWCGKEVIEVETSIRA